MNLNYTFREYVINGVKNRGLIRNSMPKMENPMECYASVFSFPQEFKTYAEKNKSVREYQGKAFADWIPIDIDNEDLEIAKLHTIKIIEKLIKVYNLNPQKIKYYFSGAKGFHILLSSSLLALTPSEDLHIKIKTFVENLIQGLDIKVDMKIYDKTRIFRIPNTINVKSGLYKIPLTYKELFDGNIETIKKMAKQPRLLPFEPAWKQNVNADLLALCNSKQPEKKDLDKTQAAPKRYAKLCIHTILNGVGTGHRDSTALRLAVHFKKQGMTKDVTYQTLLAWNKKNNPPLSDKDIEIKVNSAFNGNYDFGCNDSVLKDFCDPNCIYKNRPKPEQKLNTVMNVPDKPSIDNIYSLAEAEKKYKEYVKDIDKYRMKLGIKDIDDAIRGIGRGESCMVMGRTSVGKTIFILNIIKNIALNQHVPVLLFTLESPAEQIYERLAQMILNMTGREVEDTYKAGTNKQNLIDLLGEYVYIIDRGFLNCNQITDYIRLTEEKFKRKLGCVVIDYVGRISEYGGSQYDKTTKVVFNLTNIAKETNTAMIFLHHASSKAVAEGEPVTLSNALDSSRAVDAPDFVLGLWRNISPEQMNILNIALLKSRKGTTTQCILEFNTKNLNLTEIKKEKEKEDEKD